jgi:hypothetical protein
MDTQNSIQLKLFLIKQKQKKIMSFGSPKGTKKVIECV